MDDASQEYADSASNVSTGRDAREMEAWMKQQTEGGTSPEQPKTGSKTSDMTLSELIEGGDKKRETPPAKPARAPSDDSLGRQKIAPVRGGAKGAPTLDDAASAGRTLMRNVAEMPKQAAGGVEDAVRNAFKLATPLDGLANWLNDNVLDTRYSPVGEAKTGMGMFTRKVSEFMTGFMPATRLLKAAGVVNSVANPVLAGAVADFVVRDPAEGRLSDLWVHSGLPKNILTDYLKSATDDGPMTQRFKNSIEALGMGAAAEGLLWGARTVRAMRQVREGTPEFKQNEIDYLRTKYGELTDDELKAAGLYPKEPEPAAVAPKAGAVEQPAPAVDVAASKAKVKELLVKVKPLVEKTDLTSAEAKQFTETMAEVHALRHGYERPATVKSVAGAADRNMAPETVVAAHADLMKNKDVYAAIREAADGVKFNADTAVDKIMAGSHPTVTPNQLYDAFAATRDAIRKNEANGGDTITLYRAVGQQKEKATTNWATTEEFAKQFGPNVVKREIPIDDIIAVHVTRNGKYHEVIVGTPPAPITETSIAARQAGRVAEADVGQSLTARGVTDASDKIVQKAPTVAEVAAKKMVAAEGKINPAMEPRSLVRAQKGQPLPEDWGVYINFGRIQEPDQIKFAIGKMAESMKPHIDEARRGVMAQEETKRLADDLGMTVADLLARKKGTAFNAEEALAARQIWAASGERLVELAKSAAAKTASDLDMFAFRRHQALHAAISEEVIAARTEGARSLASWAIPAGGNIEKARAVDQMLQAMGTSQTAREMARRIAILADEGASAASIGEFARRGAMATSMDAVREAWVNGLLSSPKTHAVNIMSNTLVTYGQILERGAAEGIRAVIGGEGVAAGEAVAMTFGLVESFKDAFRMSAKALRTGESQWSFSKVDAPKAGSAHAISAEAFQISKETGAGRFVDFLGTVTNVPTRLLGAEDEFFKTIGYRMELRAQALRTATQEGLRGKDAAVRIAEILEHPPEHIRIASADAALYNTFTSEVGAFGKAIMNLRNIDSPYNPMMFILPFVRTPVNIARYAFERTPFAPLVSQWRADVAAGGARADLAIARMSTGTGIMLVAMDMADSGHISGEGPRDKDGDVREALLREGWRPYSFKAGDKWYSYNRADPFGMTIGFAASIAEAMRQGEINQDDVDEWQEVAAMTIAAVSQVTVSKTYLEGFAKFVEVMTDPKRYTQKYIDDLVASFLPATSLSNSVKNIVDPVQREVGSPADAIRARIAGLSEQLPPRRDLWGKPITSDSGMGRIYDAISPISAATEVKSPIDREMVRLNNAPERIAKRTPFDGVMANMRFYPKAYDDYTRLAGNDLKHPAWGLGAKDYLDQVVEGKHPMSAVYNMMSDESRKSFISGTISEYRKLAQASIMSNPMHKNFAQEITHLKSMQMDNKMPVLQ